MARTETVEFTNMCMICKFMNRNNRQRIQSSLFSRQKVHIEYDLVGYIPVDELLKAEQA